MPLSAFGDKSAGPPGEDALAATLGPTYPWWTALKEHLHAAHGPLTEEWGFTSKSTGWGLRLREPHRVLIYLTPGTGGFLASFALGDRAVEAARASDLPAVVIGQIEAARRYAEGRGVRLEVRSEDDLAAVRTLAAIKAAH